MLLRATLPVLLVLSLSVTSSRAVHVAVHQLASPQMALPQSNVPGQALARGMQLVYASQGAESAPWVVDSIDLTARYGRENRCSFVRFAGRDTRKTCVRGDTLFAWRDSTGSHVATRPLRTGMTLTLPVANGGRALYEVGVADTVTIGTIPVPVVRTTVTTFDGDGKAVRRLREQFALSLGTATGGVFEAIQPDGTWKVTQEFALVRIVRP